MNIMIEPDIILFLIMFILAIILLIYLLWKKIVGTLSITVNTDKTLYTKGEDVGINGTVLIDSTPVVGEAVSLAVQPPTGDAYSLPSATTDGSGAFQSTWTIPTDAVDGSYELFATARGKTVSTTFTFHNN